MTIPDERPAIAGPPSEQTHHSLSFGAPVVVSSMVDAVVERLRAMISSGVLRSGDLLPSERVLAQQLQASRNVIREALGILRVDGLVQVQPGKSSVVASPGPDQASRSLEVLLGMGEMNLVELCDVRAAIEPRIARLAATRASRGDVERLESLLEALDASNHNPARHVEVDIVFHRELARISGHRGYAWIVGAVRLPMARSMFAGTRVAPNMAEKSDGSHRCVVEAVALADADAAEAAMQAHMEHIASYVRTGVEQGWWVALG